jgi:intracellular sulfur oxidation DsrE/DsrF family protein
MTDPIVARRSFLSRLAAGTAAFTAALAGTAGLPSIASAAPVADELDTWFGSMRGPNKIIYDSASVASAPDGVMFARNLIKFSAEKLNTKDADNSIVVCFRHFATPFGYTDAMWTKYPAFISMLNITDPTTKKAATRNYLMHEEVEGQAGANLPGIRAHGVQFAICGAATAYFAKQLAGKTGNAAKIEADLAANLIPGARMAPAGVVAVQRAQKAGFAYTYAG